MQASPSHLWKLVRTRAGVERAFYDAYYQDHDMAYGIVLGRTRLFERALSLQALRVAWPGFTPPQSYRYVTVRGEGAAVDSRGAVATETGGQFALHLQQ